MSRQELGPKIGRRRVLTSLGAGAGLALAAPYVLSSTVRAANRTLYVNSYGGVLETSQAKAFYNPFGASIGIDVVPVAPVSYAKLAAEVKSGNYEWDVTNMNEVEIAQAEFDGLVQPIDFSIVKKDQIPATMFVQDGVSSYSLGTNLVYRKDKFPNGGPQNWADFWNVDKFPGGRCLYNRPHTNICLALLADGVPKEKLYPLDLDRAFKKLDQIKAHIKVWWTEGTQSQQLIRDGEVDMICMWSARAVDLIRQNVPIEMVWQDAEVLTSNWFVPKGDPRAELAFQYMNFVSQPGPQAEFAKLLPYGPTNPAAVAMLPTEVARLTPTYPENFKLIFTHDAQWLAPRLGAIRERWTEWLAG